jgi:hypothetical protein
MRIGLGSEEAAIVGQDRGEPVEPVLKGLEASDPAWLGRLGAAQVDGKRFKRKTALLSATAALLAGQRCRQFFELGLKVEAHLSQTFRGFRRDVCGRRIGRDPAEIVDETAERLEAQTAGLSLEAAIARSQSFIAEGSRARLRRKSKTPAIAEPMMTKASSCANRFRTPRERATSVFSEQSEPEP